MPEPYGMHVVFTAKRGHADELEALLLEAAAAMRDQPACRVYVVSRSAPTDDTVHVTELWTDRAAHDATLEDEAARAAIGRALPLLDGRPRATELRPVGGKGL